GHPPRHRLGPGGPLPLRRDPEGQPGPSRRKGPDRAADRLAARPMRGCVITGWGTALPDRVVTNKDLTTIFDTTEEWIEERSGIKTRRAATGPFVDPP